MSIKFNNCENWDEINHSIKSDLIIELGLADNNRFLNLDKSWILFHPLIENTLQNIESICLYNSCTPNIM